VGTFVIGLAAGMVIAGVPVWVQVTRARRAAPELLPGIPLRAGVVPDPGPRYEPYTEADIAADLADQVWN
jgi:hypothetical protein